MSTTAASTRQTIRLRNKSGHEQQLWIEPLGDFVPLAPNGLYEITVTNDLDEIDLSDDGFTVHGWVEQVCEVAADGSLATVWKLPQ
jgi:hypothetical protein